MWVGLFGVLLKDRVSLQHSELSIPPELHILNNSSAGQVSLRILAATASAMEGLLLSLTSLSPLLSPA